MEQRHETISFLVSWELMTAVLAATVTLLSVEEKLASLNLLLHCPNQPMVLPYTHE